MCSRQTKNIKNEICKMFIENKLKIMIEANLKTVDFLDIIMDIFPANTTYMKPDKHHYICTQTKQPSTTHYQKHPKKFHQKTISNISSNETILNKAMPPYQEPVTNADMTAKLRMEYKPTLTNDNDQCNKPQSKRKRDNALIFFVDTSFSSRRRKFK